MLARRRLDDGELDCVCDNDAIFTVIPSTSSSPLGGVESGVSESVVSSFDERLSPLLRGLEMFFDRAAMSSDILEKGVWCCFGSLGMGLFGSLELQLGMLWCRWCGIVVENEIRFSKTRSSCCVAICVPDRLVGLV